MTSDVPAPTNLMPERQLSTSFIIAWSPPLNIAQDEILAYNIYSNGLFLTTVRSDDRTKALLEKLDPSKVCFHYAFNCASVMAFSATTGFLIVSPLLEVDRSVVE